MKELEGLDIRYTRPMDISYLRQWVQQPKVLEHLPMNNEKEIELELESWMFFCKYQASLTATLNHIPCGIATLSLMSYKKLCHECSFRICVDPRLWNKGIGTSLLKNIMHLAKEYFHLEAMYIEVFEGCPLIPLLKQFGFYEFLRQELYVKTEKGYKARLCFICKLKEGL